MKHFSLRPLIPCLRRRLCPFPSHFFSHPWSRLTAAMEESSITEPQSLRLRSYQQEMVDESLHRNIIVAIDTGGGKTAVAVSRAELELQSCEPDKLVWMLAPTVALCEQQCSVFAKYLPAYISRVLCGNDGVDHWTDQTIWDAVLENIRIVVSTPGVLLDALSHGFVKLSRLVLLIFDEAHHCIRKSPGNQIMNLFYRPAKARGAAVPRILGLSASPVFNARANSMDVIEANLDARIVSPRVHRSELTRFVHRPQLEQLVYSPVLSPTTPLFTALGSTYQNLILEEDPYVIYLKSKDDHQSSSELLKIRMKQNPRTYCFDQLRLLNTRVKDLWTDLGIRAATDYLIACIDCFSENDASPLKLQALSDLEREERLFVQSRLVRVKSAGKSRHTANATETADISPKVQALIKILLKEWNTDFTGIIFVEQRAMVAALARLLNTVPEISSKYNIATFVGTSTSSNRKKTIVDAVEPPNQQNTLEDFRVGKINLIIATNVLEEGIDVSTCHIVICFDPPPNLKSFIQRRGRARKQNSKFFIMVSEDAAVSTDPGKWGDLEELMKQAYLDDLRKVQEAEAREAVDEPGERHLRIEKTGALITLDNVVAHLHHFCSTLRAGAYVDARPEYSFEKGPKQTVKAGVSLPTVLAPFLRHFSGTQFWSTERKARQDASFTAYEALHKAGLVNDNLLPLVQDIEEVHDPIEKMPSLMETGQSLSPWSQRIFQDKTLDMERFAVHVSNGESTFTHILAFPVGARESPVPGDFSLFWNENTSYTVHMERLTNLIGVPDGDIATFQKCTGLILGTAIPRLQNGKRDYLVYLLPMVEDGDSLDAWIKRNSGVQGIDEQRVHEQGLGLVHGMSDYDGRYLFCGISSSPLKAAKCKHAEVKTSEMGEDGPYVMVNKFPKRTDFLHLVVRKVNANEAYTAVQTIPHHLCKMAKLPISSIMMGMFLPSILHRFENALVANELRTTFLSSVDIPDVELIQTAITQPAADGSRNYERLEFIGDCVLKFCTCILLSIQHPTWPEGYLSASKSGKVSNGVLANASLAAGLDRFINRKRFTGLKWKPVYTGDLLRKSDEQPDTPSQANISSKVLADVVESLIGAAYISNGLPAAINTLSFLLPNEPWHLVSNGASTLYDATPSQSTLHLESLESLIGYKFNNKELMRQATTHANYVAPASQQSFVMSYERLEFLGDAILDLLIGRRLFAHGQATGEELTPANMTVMRHALASADFLAFLCLNYSKSVATTKTSVDQTTGQIERWVESQGTQLWRFMRHSSAKITTAQQTVLAAFTTQNLGAAIRHELDHGAEFPWSLLTRLGPPKFFSDLVESTLAAIWIDSRGDLEACEAFVERIGLVKVAERMLREKGWECLHPIAQVEILAGKGGRGQGAEGKRAVEWKVQRVERGGDGERWRAQVVVGGKIVVGAAEGVSRQHALVEGAVQAVQAL
ncbi:P-loop containing nucleoside triphosphate hydrolase protein [Aulographum hederae CBS 113979]|uniref:P-loop containing nucleoside triphosphate hydrolase protein n=1 Tax=Aulographum hederae CBS 113979 TaxID=1176131 RepID=A0A6G1H6C8_9PEZI|nr:P-loop containing nucleoside triphosphate hydrolase protein [Aulographum hederae CBS 113979]